MEILIRQYQMWAGLQRPILVDTRPCPWIPDRWLSRIRRTLREHRIQIQYEAWTIPALRHQDVFIMEAIEDLALSVSQMEQINACRMYLKVTTLAEITDHTGTLLLPQALLHKPHQQPQGLQDLSTSVLEWPQIHCPSKGSWALWTSTICNLFTGSNSGSCLHHPLGPWTRDYNTYRHWHWRMAPAERLLHRPTNMTRPRAALPVRTQQTQITFSPTILTNQLFEGPPVTPFDTHQRIIRLPIAALPSGPDPTPTIRCQKSLVAQFRSTLESWQRPLYGPIQRLQPTACLRDSNQAHLPLTLVSDASVQKNKQSSFAWVITQDATPLWRGVGLAPGYAEDIYSGRAEAFGLFAALLFVQHYVISYGPTQFTDAPLKCYCDNAGVITNVTDLLAPHAKRPNDTTNDDRDVYLAIQETISHCSPLQIHLFHVKGHQDKDPKRKLTLLEMLNIECDRKAKQYAHATPQSSTALGNPPIPAAQPHLIIDGKIICCNTIPSLRQVTSTQPYRRYLKDKYLWDERTLNTVHWEVFSSALHSFPMEDQRRLILFINDKLPLRASKAHPHYGSKLCPSCQREPETPQHLMRCKHGSREELFRNLKSTLTNKTQALQLHPSIFTTWWLGLVTRCNGTEYPDILQDVPHQLRKTILSQTRLGWEQLLLGRISITWAQAIDDLNPTLAPSGTQVLITMLRMMWSYVLSVWKLRNTNLHHSANQLNLPNYRQAAITLYELRYQLPPMAQTALYRQPLEQLLELPAPRLQRWVQTGYQYFNQQIKAAKRQATLQTQDIQTFFCPQHLQDDDLQPP